jgi:hypothetical protein
MRPALHQHRQPTGIINRLLHGVLLVLIAAWLLTGFYQTTLPLMREHWRRVLRANPIDIQSAGGTTFAQYVFELGRSIPPGASVAFVMKDPTTNIAFAHFYADYWLFPRQNLVTGSLATALHSRPNRLVFMGRQLAASHASPTLTSQGYTLVGSNTYDGYFVIEEWERHEP